MDQDRQYAEVNKVFQILKVLQILLELLVITIRMKIYVDYYVIGGKTRRKMNDNKKHEFKI